MNQIQQIANTKMKYKVSLYVKKDSNERKSYLKMRESLNSQDVGFKQPLLSQTLTHFKMKSTIVDSNNKPFGLETPSTVSAYKEMVKLNNTINAFNLRLKTLRLKVNSPDVSAQEVRDYEMIKGQRDKNVEVLNAIIEKMAQKHRIPAEEVPSFVKRYTKEWENNIIETFKRVETKEAIRFNKQPAQIQNAIENQFACKVDLNSVPYIRFSGELKPQDLIGFLFNLVVFNKEQPFTWNMLVSIEGVDVDSQTHLMETIDLRNVDSQQNIIDTHTTYEVFASLANNDNAKAKLIATKYVWGDYAPSGDNNLMVLRNTLQYDPPFMLSNDNPKIINAIAHSLSLKNIRNAVETMQKRKTSLKLSNNLENVIPTIRTMLDVYQQKSATALNKISDLSEEKIEHIMTLTGATKEEIALVFNVKSVKELNKKASEETEKLKTMSFIDFTNNVWQPLGFQKS